MPALSFLHAALAALVILIPFRVAAAFGLDDVDRQAAALARTPYTAAAEVTVEAADYDSHRQMRFVRERALWHGQGTPFEVQFFPAGAGFNRPVQVFEVVGERVRPVTLAQADFAAPDGAPRRTAGDAAIAGVRVLHPLHRHDHFDEVIAFLGASYFRAVGQQQQYGLSARGVAIDTVEGPRGEQFPDFTRFWFVRPDPGADTLTLYALLDGAHLTGAYRFDIRPGARTVVDVQARWHFRQALTTFGVAPLTSMFMSGENQPPADDFRPEVHDSDGLQIATGTEWLWRPLIRPAHPFTTVFAVPQLRGFGLMQRDRDFTNYQDLEAHYERRPSAWVEPVGDWGPGRVVLLQLPAHDETQDNVVAFWQPANAPRPGEPLAMAWRLHWSADAAPPPPLARVVQSRRGFGFRAVASAPGRHQFHVDFVGPALAALPAAAPVQPEVSASASARGLKARVEPNPHTGGWRMTVEFARTDPRQSIELRGRLRLGAQALTETWSYVLAPE